MPTARKMITDTANSDNSPNAKRCRSNLKILFTAQFLEMGTLVKTTPIYCGSGLAREGGLTFNVDVD